MSGALSTLGLGSQGVLTNDLLDKLKDADKSATIKPIERNQKSLTLQQAGLIGMKDAIAELTELSTSLSDLALYSTKQSSLIGDSVSITVTDAAISQDIEVNVTQLATRDINSSVGFATKDAALNTSNITINIGDTALEITIGSDDTLEDIMKNINNNSDGKVSASILNVGGSEPYQLILKSAETGAANEISVAGSGAATLGFSRVGDAPQDAILTVDGISVTSASNTLDDVVAGVSIKLEKLGSTTVSVSQDSEKIVEKMGEFVTKYNELLDSVKTLTNYDGEKKVAGVFQGSSEIRGMLAPLKDIFSSTISGAGKMVEDFGITVDRGGKLTLDKDKFKETLASDTLSVKNFFIGEGENKGIFRTMNSELFNIGTSSDGILKTMKVNYDLKEKSLAESLEKAQARLDNKYEIMQKRFAAYDAVIGRLSNASSTLTALIDAQSGKK